MWHIISAGSNVTETLQGFYGAYGGTWRVIPVLCNMLVLSRVLYEAYLVCLHKIQKCYRDHSVQRFTVEHVKPHTPRGLYYYEECVYITALEH